MSGEPWRVEHDEKYDAWLLVRTHADGTRSSRSFGADEDRARATLARWTALGPCRECGTVIDDGYMESVERRILDLRLCHSCLFWTDRLSAKDQPGHFVASGCHYEIAPDQPKHYRGFVGHGGAEFVVRFKADGREVTTRNLWAQGRVPEHFRDRLPDTAEFVRRGHERIGAYAGFGGAGSADAEVNR